MQVATSILRLGIAAKISGTNPMLQGCRAPSPPSLPPPPQSHDAGSGRLGCVRVVQAVTPVEGRYGRLEAQQITVIPKVAKGYANSSPSESSDPHSLDTCRWSSRLPRRKDFGIRPLEHFQISTKHQSKDTSSFHAIINEKRASRLGYESDT